MKGAFFLWQREPSAFLDSNGVFKKVKSQVAFFDKNTESCELVIFPKSKPVSTLKALVSLPFVYAYKKKYSEYDYIYIRRPIVLAMPFLLHLLKTIRRKNPSIKVVFEIPTYPYDNEENSFVSKLLNNLDCSCRNKLNKFVNRISTFSNDDEIFNIPTIRISNGIDVQSVLTCQKETYHEQEINIVAVANFAPWHGFDRFLKGLIGYYKSCPDVKVLLHVVGSGTGTDETEYREIVKNNGLEKFVYFYGNLSGDYLSDVFNKADIGLCSLGNHRKGLYLTSELKSREYLARGLPIVSSTKIDIIPEGWKYCFYVPEDETNINIADIVSFCNRVYSEKPRSEILKDIRTFAEEKCDMSNTMKPVLEFIMER